VGNFTARRWRSWLDHHSCSIQLLRYQYCTVALRACFGSLIVAAPPSLEPNFRRYPPTPDINPPHPFPIIISRTEVWPVSPACVDCSLFLLVFLLVLYLLLLFFFTHSFFFCENFISPSSTSLPFFLLSLRLFFPLVFSFTSPPPPPLHPPPAS